MDYLLSSILQLMRYVKDEDSFIAIFLFRTLYKISNP